MPKSAHSVEGATVEDHAAMKKQWQTNLEIDLLKSAWIRKDREQHGAHSAPPLSAAKEEKTTVRSSQDEGERDAHPEEEAKPSTRAVEVPAAASSSSVAPHSDHPSIVDY
ncbi:hypothetical protein F443_04518 [Phytophthora nicotianae P1569]|uniref:Uncharacterized protein n=3 Tax=Phytophthora nicotianae TaxID=4792 RepID=V9FPG5_PHYNI|nr:hypothetical protein F443_04518 [Phytophthora nicotianae P1569]